MKSVIVFAVVLFLTNAAHCQEKKKPVLAKAIGDNNYVRIQGVWEPDIPTKHNDLVFSVNHIECYRNGGRDIVGTDSFCLEALATPVEGTISVSTRWLKVVEWSKTEIIAVDDSPDCLTAQTIINLTSETAIALDIRKPNAEGFNGACKLVPDRQTYYLREQVDYALSRGGKK